MLVRAVKSTGSVTVRSAAPAGASPSSTMPTAVRPCSRGCCCTVVSPNSGASACPSIPATESSAGTAMPSCRAARIWAEGDPVCADLERAFAAQLRSVLGIDLRQIPRQERSR